MGSVAGLYVCEMVTARALVERNEKTLHMTTFAPDENPRSLQLYTTDPEYTYKAAKMIVDENLADHIDMNFGCPVPKVTRCGGGSALPYKRRLFANIVAAAVKATEGTDVPVTVKFRIGIDDEHHTHLDTVRDWMNEHGEKGESTVVACTALKGAHRETLNQAKGTVFYVHLYGTEDMLQSRMANRIGENMPPELLEKQLTMLETLKADELGIQLDVTRSPEQLEEDSMAAANFAAKADQS